MASMENNHKLSLVEYSNEDINVSRQCELLGISRASAYRFRREQPEKDNAIMKAIDRIYTDYPFYGSRRITEVLRREGKTINRKRIQRLMRQMGIEGLHPKKRTTISNKQHKKYPYLLRNVQITRPNQVWSSDITYIPAKHGFFYLTAVIDWYSRYVLSWEFSNSLESSFCTDATEKALEVYGTPEIFNTDQGSQYTSVTHTGLLADAGVAISMDGRGRALDNVFIERLWRTLKYEDVYLKDYACGHEASLGISKFLEFYNTERIHSSLGNRTPKEVYMN